MAGPYVPIADTVPQYQDANGQPASGFVLKAYKAGTTTATNMYTDNAGSGGTTTFDLDSEGYPEVSGNITLPWLDTQTNYKFSLYRNSTDASNNQDAVWTIDNIVPAQGIGAKVVASISEIEGSGLSGNSYIWVSGENGEPREPGFYWLDPNGGAKDGFFVVEDNDGNIFRRQQTNTVNVLDFGAVGDDSNDDRAAIQDAFDAVPSGGTVIIPGDKTYRFKDDNNGDAFVLVEDKDITVIAYGAEIKMGANTGYNAFRITIKNNARINYVHWYGGTLNGNKSEQQWKGDGSGGSTVQDQGNNGLLGVTSASLAYFEGVLVKENISDGIVGAYCNLTSFNGCVGLDGVSPDDIFPQTFKARHGDGDYAGVFLAQGCYVDGANIAYGSSDKPVATGNEMYVIGCKAIDCTQRAVSNEVAEIMKISDCSFRTSDNSTYTMKVHINNECKSYTVANTYIDGGNIDGNNASSLEQGHVTNTTVINNPLAMGAIRCTKDSPTSVVGCYVKDSAGRGINAKYVAECFVKNCSNTNIDAVKAVACETSGDGTQVGIRCKEAINCDIDNCLDGYIDNGDTLKVYGGTVTNCQSNVAEHGGDASGILRLIAVECEDFGKDSGLSAFERAAVAGINGNAIGAKEVSVKDCRFERTDTNKDWGGTAIGVGSKVEYLFYENNNEVDLQVEVDFDETAPLRGKVETSLPLNDDQVVRMPAAQGVGFAFADDEYLPFRFKTGGTLLSLSDASTNTATSDSDGNLCVITDGPNSAPAIKNRLGGSKKTTINYVFHG